MSLRVWLPLDGNLNNQGCDKMSSVNVPVCATVDTSGKIGKCYTSTGANNGVTTDFEFDAAAFSIAAWVRINTRVNAWHCPFKLINSSAAADYAYIGFGCEHNTDATLVGFHFYHMVDGTNTSVFDAYPTTCTVGEWTHFAIAYDGVIVSYYKNGVRVQQATLPAAKQHSVAHMKKLIMFGTDGARGASTTKTSLNDVRIYDHCLSAAEVKEISQGLVLHYKLDGPLGGAKENLLPCGGTYTQASPLTRTSNKVDGNAWISNSAFEAKPSTTYTISVECDGTLASTHAQSSDPDDKKWGFWLYICNTDTTKNWSGGSYDTPVFLSNNNNNYRQIGSTHVWTYTLSSTQKYISLRTNIYSNGTDNVTIKWWDMKVEEGDKYTLWVPPTSMLGIDATKVEDSSGYGHHGEIVHAVEASSDTPRYETSTHFSATNQYIHCGGLTTTGFGSSYTFAWWGKCETYSGRMMWGFSDGIRLNGVYNGVLWNTGDGSNNPLYKPETTTAVATPSVNEWHHFAMVGDGSTCKAYLDGELWGQAKTYKNISGTTIYLNGWDSGTSYSNSDASLSDFRMYCTALSAEDILELYHTSAKIDNLGGIHTYELKENVSNLLYKKRCVQDSHSSFTYDEATNTYEITLSSNTSSWGYGLALTKADHDLYIPWGMSYRLTMEVYSPKAGTFNIDYNNAADDMTDMSGNDNDTGRLYSGIAVPANTWTRITYGASNANTTKNPHHLPIYDYSHFGMVNQNTDETLVYQVRNVQWYLVDDTHQITKHGIINANYLNETSLTGIASIRDKEKSIEATEFIEE